MSTTAEMTMGEVRQGIGAAQERAAALTTEIDALGEEKIGVAFDSFAGDEGAIRRRGEIEEEIARKRAERDDMHLAIQAGERKYAALRGEEAAAQRAQDLVLLGELDTERDAALVAFEDVAETLVVAARKARETEMAWLIQAARCEVHAGLPPTERMPGYLAHKLAGVGISTGPMASHPQLAAPLSATKLVAWEEEQRARRG